MINKVNIKHQRDFWISLFAKQFHQWASNLPLAAGLRMQAKEQVGGLRKKKEAEQLPIAYNVQLAEQ